MKNFVSIFCALVILFPDSVFAFSDTPAYTESIVSECFETYATNEEWEYADGAYGTRIIDEGKNKKLLLKADTDGASISVPANMNGKIIVSFDVQIGGGLESASFMSLKDSAGKVYKLLYLEDHSVYVYGGKMARDISVGKGVHHYTFQIDFDKKRYSIGSDGRERLRNWYVPLPSSVTSFQMDFSPAGDPVDIKIDNIRVYQGGSIRTNFEPETYNSEETWFDPDDTEDSEQTVYYSNDFESMTGISNAGISAVNMKEEYGNQIEAMDVEGNRYIQISRKASDPFLDFAMKPDRDRFVVQADFYLKKKGANVLLFHLRDSNAQFNQLVGLNALGMITTPKGGVVTEMPVKKWTAVACAVNAKKQTYDVYVNGVLLQSGIEYSNVEFSVPALCRFTFSGAAADCVIGIDNVYAYSGSEIVSELGASERKAVFADDEAIEKQLKDTAALTAYNGAAWMNNRKVMLDIKPVKSEGKIWAPAEFYEKAYGAEPIENDGNYYINHAEVEGFSDHGTIFVDFESAAKEAFSLNSFIDYEKGFAVMGKRSFSKYSDRTTDYDGNNYLVLSRGEYGYRDILNYMLYERPSAEEILARFQESSAGQHPRILGTKSEFDTIREQIQTDPVKARWADTFIKNVDAVVGRHKLPEYVLFDGERMSFPYDRHMKMAFAYQLTGDRKYCEDIYRDIEAMAAFPDWHPAHFLDTAGAAFGVAVAYDWCYDYWSETQKQTIREALYKHGLATGWNDLYGGATSKWTAWNNNWAAVCWGSLGISAIALMDDYPKEASELIEGSLKGIGYMMPMFAPDGAWAEGPSYWNYCLTFFTRYFASLESALGTSYGYVDQEGVEGTMLYPYALNGPAGIFNFHDSGTSAIDTLPNGYLSKHFNDQNINMLRLNDITTPAVDDFFYIDTTEAYRAPEDLPLDLKYDLTNTGVMRSSWFDSGSAFAGYHCSPNSPVHRNFDSGTFIYQFAGVRWATELGMDSYTLPNYWAAENNPIYRVRTEGQNCYVINPGKDSGQRFESEDKIVKTESKPRAAYAVMDLTSAYQDDVNSALRGIMLSDNRTSMTVRDEIDFKQKSEFYWFMHTEADVEITGANTAVLTKGSKMYLEFISNQPLELSVSEAVPLDPTVSPQNTENKGIRKLVIQGSAEGGLKLTVKLTPEIMYSGQPLPDQAISEWALPDGGLPDTPVIDGIFADGVLINGFSADKTYYTILKDASKNYPEISAACADQYKIDIADSQKGTYNIYVTNRSDPNNRNMYSLVYKNYIETAGSEAYQLLLPVTYEASAEPEASNPASNIIDADASTRWSAEGKESMTYTFDSPKSIAAIGIAFYNGSKRKTYYSIQVSNDGTNFETVKECASSGTTEEMELVKLDSDVSARYIRILGGGNDENEWFSPTEWYVFGK